MHKSELRFQVDSRLATLLSQEYSSSEKALKELVDNAWDADAENVAVTLPSPMSAMPIVITDDGSGMTEEELRRHYLFIATDRRSHRGERTSGKNRQIKGRKGIGKFSGLMVASTMMLETRARGRLCSFTLRLEDLANVADIEHLNIAFRTEPCDEKLHGTTITLSNLHQNFVYPDANKMRQVLLQDYGRQDDFCLSIDGKKLAVDDLSGSYSDIEKELPVLGLVKLRFTISDKKSGLRQPGITLRVDGKSIGKPKFFGLDELDDFPPKLLRKLYGEVDADGLRDHITAGWDAPVENSELLKVLEVHVQSILREAFELQYRREIQLAQARLQKAIQIRLAQLPEHKRYFADKAIKRVLDKYYGEPESKVESIVHVLLEALEHSDYRTLLEHIAESQRHDIFAIADGLYDFGLAEMAWFVQQAQAREAFLNQLEQLATSSDTSEAIMHKALENALWVFGSEYSLFSSNITLRRQVEGFLGRQYVGEKSNQRPDLLLNENLNGEYLLIEFKKPTHALNHENYLQAITYRHELGKYINASIKVLLIGGRRSPDYPMDNREPNVNAMTFSQLIATARRQLEWLLRERGM
ncbi:ATP-binding protein [Aeromonas hydrophila]|uniref:ATP-binding protein n=1 Tax=Aeromonas hydrophila TaxID=644 RepID=UPI00083C9ED4|nr:ATP-binding protein [Aeromonas hydrophila]MCX4042908.1 ATP-binding protein [Aeromonas hydrophila]OCX99304.1 phosphonate ABC transporter permease [Aeromonas hydrophila]OCY06729.1 phosphonate ABC transporter permease [Aeromonas hydrophila]HAU4875370.1 ATP-binding protein [Aeromonas hydrophila]HAU4921074.1 ATP-binding protein [Aeromonas hydrophila]